MRFKAFFSLTFTIIITRVVSESLCSDDKVGNKCLCISFTNETSLPGTMVDCKDLDLSAFPESARLPEVVTFLDLSFNNIETLDSNVTSDILKKLVVSYNKINSIGENFFHGLPGLNILDLSHNNLSSFRDGDVFLKQTNLAFLDLSFNNFKDLPAAIFDPLHIMTHLDLSYNPMGDYLMKSKDVLSRELGIGTNISHLRMNNLGLNDLHPDFFGPYVNLKHLELEDNNFDIIPNVPYSLEFLDFSGNNLTFVSAKYLNYHSLKTLRLSRMPSLTSIHHYAFYNLQALESLIITDCPNLQEFTDLAFGIASKTMEIHLKALVLSRNGLRSFNSTYKHIFKTMEHIDLRHNPWICNCDILWLQEFASELLKGREIRCADPKVIKNKSVMDLIHKDLPQCYPEIYGKTSHRVLIVVLMATILFLMGLIFYLVRYPRNWVNPRHIGANSPYSQAPQDQRF